MTYKADERDVEFNLFEWLDLKKILGFEAFREHTIDLYKMVLKEGLKFAQNELSPLNKKADAVGCSLDKKGVTTPPGFRDAYQKFAQNGFIAPEISPQYGGQGLCHPVASAVSEYLTGANVAFTMYAGLSKGGAHLIESFASEELAKRFCPKMFGGTWAGTMCLTEPQAGSAVGDIKTSAKKNKDGTYSVMGNKIFISCGEHDLTENIIHLVLARAEGDPEGTRGLSLFIVPKIWVHDDGSLGEPNDVACVNIEEKMGIHGSATCSLNFGENKKCRAHLVGEQSLGIKYMFKLMNEARLLCGVQGQAIAGTAFEHAKDYAKERVQGGKTLIIAYPDVRRNLAICKSLVEAMRGMLLYTAWQISVGKHSNDPTEKDKAQNRADLLTPICKAYCSDMGFRVTELAMQIYGGYGYIAEYPIEQYMRDVKISSIYEGTNGIQALDLLGRKLSMKNGELFQEFYQDLSEFITKNENHKELKSEILELKKAVDSVGQAAMQFAQWSSQGDRIKPQLGATPFLEMCGHTVAAFVLLSQAVLAQTQIEKENFYQDKVLTARFFVHNLLPKVRMFSKAILSGDDSAMKLQF